MKCPNCGKDLPENILFCPYCMTKFSGDGVQGQVKQNKKNKKTLITVGIVVSLIALMVAIMLIFILLGDADKKNASDNKENQIGEESNSNISKDNDDDAEINPLDYCGTWYNKDFEGEDPMTEGGTVLKIMSMTKDSVIFDICVYQAPPASRVAGITGIEANIVDGKAEFIFGDDGWGNGGIGTILFMDGEIYVNIKLTTISSDSLWDVGTDKIFKKVDESYENDNIDFMGVVGEQVDVVLYMISDLPYEYQPRDSEEEPYRFGGITIETDNDIVTSILVDYTEFPEGYRDKLCFSFGVNGRANYDYMEYRLGECINTYEKDGNYINVFNSPEDKESYIEVTYSHGEVVSIRYYAD